jgi:hypothetical protein
MPFFTRLFGIAAALFVAFAPISTSAQISADSLLRIHAKTPYMKYKGMTKQDLKAIP